MSLSRDIRRLAFQLLFQLDASPGSDALELSQMFSDEAGPKDRKAAAEFATQAFAGRAVADEAMKELAPTWPANRQPAVDRAILRLGHHEITTDQSTGAIVINEAVELAKEFGTDKSPAFINALLDRVHKKHTNDPTPPIELPM
ncbi:MAG: transcription antitermination factor NusB [Planctomycetota bacterium]